MMKMQKKVVISIGVLVILLLIGTLMLWESKSNETLLRINNQAVREYQQIAEYPSDFGAALNSDSKEKKLELAAVALSKISSARSGIYYLTPILEEEGIDPSFLFDRVHMMSVNTKHYILEISAHGAIDDKLQRKIEKDMKDAEYIFKTLNYQWIRERDYEKVKQAIASINTELANNSR
jgi:hypothetical protein